MGWEGGISQALGWAGSQGDPGTLANRHPQVEPALYHRGSPRWPVGDGARALTTQPPPLDCVAPPGCVLAQGYPPPGYTPTPR